MIRSPDSVSRNPERTKSIVPCSGIIGGGIGTEHENNGTKEDFYFSLFSCFILFLFWIQRMEGIIYLFRNRKEWSWWKKGAGQRETKIKEEEVEDEEKGDRKWDEV